MWGLSWLGLGFEGFVEGEHLLGGDGDVEFFADGLVAITAEGAGSFGVGEEIAEGGGEGGEVVGLE